MLVLESKGIRLPFAVYIGTVLPATFNHSFVSFRPTTPVSQRWKRDIYSCDFCPCSPRLGAAGETHLNANVLLLLHAKSQVNELVEKEKFTPRCASNGSATEKEEYFNNLEHSRVDGQIGSTRVCADTDTHKFRGSVVQYNSLLLNIQYHLMFSHNSFGGAKKTLPTESWLYITSLHSEHMQLLNQFEKKKSFDLGFSLIHFRIFGCSRSRISVFVSI